MTTRRKKSSGDASIRWFKVLRDSLIKGEGDKNQSVYHRGKEREKNCMELLPTAAPATYYNFHILNPKFTRHFHLHRQFIPFFPMLCLSVFPHCTTGEDYLKSLQRVHTL